MTETAREKNRQVGDRLRQAMKKCGMTGNALSNKTGFHFTHISKLLNGHAQLMPENAERFAELLNCDPRWLMFGDDGVEGEAKSTPQTHQEAEAAALAVQVVRERPDKTERLLGLLRGLLLGAAICAAPVVSYGKPMARCTPENYPAGLHNPSSRNKRRNRDAA